MSGFLLDTNCISELVRTKPEPRVLAWIESADEASLRLSVLTLGEIRKCVANLPESRRRLQLETWLETDLRIRFSGRILPVDAPVVDQWGVLAARARRAGMVLPVIDGLLAATAMTHDLTLVTRNVSDVGYIGVSVVNPWTD